jgi:hypothetical protein
LVAVVLVIVFKYEQFFVYKDYELYVNVNCDPSSEECFAVDCSIDDPECDQTPYKKVALMANSAPACLLNRTCLDFQCSEVGERCVTNYCSEDSIEEGEKCIRVEVDSDVSVEEFSESDL